MPDLRTILGTLEKHFCVSPAFTARVLHAVEIFEERRARKAILRTGGLLLASVFVFFGSAGVVLDALSANEADGLLSVVTHDPQTLMLSETWMAILDVLPIMALVLSCIALVSCVILLYRFFHPFSPRPHHATA